MSRRIASGFAYRVGDDLVAGRVRVLIRSARRGSALPGPLADPGHVARQGAESRYRHRIAEVRGAECAEYVGDAVAGLRVGLVKLAVERGGDPLAGQRDRTARRPPAPLGA